MTTMNIKLTGSPFPAYAKQGDAAFDLFLNIEEAITLQPDQTVKIGCGIAMEIPEGHFGMVVPRSSLSKRNLMMANTLGIIDSGYRGEILTVIRNIGTTPEVLNPQDRLFQMAIIPFTQVTFNSVENLSDTDRGEGGFGSTSHLSKAG